MFLFYGQETDKLVKLQLHYKNQAIIFLLSS